MRKAKKEKERKKSDIGEANRDREKKNGDFLGVPTIGARRSEKKSRSTHHELPKSWSFVKLHEVGNFTTWNIYSLKVI